MRIGTWTALLVLSAGTASAFMAGPPRQAMQMSAERPRGTASRQDVLQGAFVAGAAALLGLPGAGVAINIPTGPSKAELLEKTRGKKSEEEIKAEKERLAAIRAERLRKAKEQAAEEEARKNDPNKKEVEIDADLRANYYYPTSRKRYLPRIKAVADNIDSTRAKVEGGDWAEVERFANKEADDAALPLKLYASSLTGQGLSLEVSYVKVLVDQSEVYGKQLDALKKAVKGKNKDQALVALTKMDEAIKAYRKAARIDTADGGVGEFPTDTKLGAAFGNNNPTLYRKNQGAAR